MHIEKIAIHLITKPDVSLITYLVKLIYDDKHEWRELSFHICVSCLIALPVFLIVITNHL